jgi:hypothetical protein
MMAPSPDPTPRVDRVGQQGPPAPSLRCARRALRYGAGPSYWLPGQPAKNKPRTSVDRDSSSSIIGNDTTGIGPT